MAEKMYKLPLPRVGGHSRDRAFELHRVGGGVGEDEVADRVPVDTAAEAAGDLRVRRRNIHDMPHAVTPGQKLPVHCRAVRAETAADDAGIWRRSLNGPVWTGV